mmetsp:Transcript_84304/g.148851  ORF Transcript_84304/g.148851 Transcript_84304/m.148851 type:complete len:357 (+) Transcript_84304:71-1141(+)
MMVHMCLFVIGLVLFILKKVFYRWFALQDLSRKFEFWWLKLLGVVGIDFMMLSSVISFQLKFTILAMLVATASDVLLRVFEPKESKASLLKVLEPSNGSISLEFTVRNMYEDFHNAPLSRCVMTFACQCMCFGVGIGSIMQIFLDPEARSHTMYTRWDYAWRVVFTILLQMTAMFKRGDNSQVGRLYNSLFWQGLTRDEWAGVKIICDDKLLMPTLLEKRLRCLMDFAVDSIMRTFVAYGTLFVVIFAESAKEILSDCLAFTFIVTINDLSHTYTVRLERDSVDDESGSESVSVASDAARVSERGVKRRRQEGEGFPAKRPAKLVHSLKVEVPAEKEKILSEAGYRMGRLLKPVAS